MSILTPGRVIGFSLLAAYTSAVFTFGVTYGYESAKKKAPDYLVYAPPLEPTPELVKGSCHHNFLLNQPKHDSRFERQVIVEDLKGVGHTLDDYLCWVRYTVIKRQNRMSQVTEGNVEYFTLSENDQLRYQKINLDQFNDLLESKFTLRDKEAH